MGVDMKDLNDYIEAIAPKEGELQSDGETFFANMVDEELDPFRIDFTGDGCATINCKPYTYLSLNEDQLLTLLDLLEESEAAYSRLNNID